MKIGFPANGSFQIVDNVKFTFFARDSGDTGLWQAGPLADDIIERVNLNTGKSEFFVHTFALIPRDRHHRTFVRAALAAIRSRKEAVDSARRLVNDYDTAMEAAVIAEIKAVKV